VLPRRLEEKAVSVFIPSHFALASLACRMDTERSKQTIKPMGMMKNYLLKLLEKCSDEAFGQDAVEWAIVSGWVKLTYHLNDDVQTIRSQYDQLAAAYRQRVSELTEQSLEVMQPLIAQIRIAPRQDDDDAQLAIARADQDDWRVDR
jgi:hypothetical protein